MWAPWHRDEGMRQRDQSRRGDCEDHKEQGPVRGRDWVEEKEKGGIETDSKCLCLADLENSDIIYNNQKSHFGGKLMHSALDPSVWEIHWNIRVQRGRCSKFRLELRRGVRGKEVNTDSVLKPLAFVISFLMAGPSPTCFCGLPLCLWSAWCV